MERSALRSIEWGTTHLSQSWQRGIGVAAFESPKEKPVSQNVTCVFGSVGVIQIFSYRLPSDYWVLSVIMKLIGANRWHEYIYIQSQYLGLGK